MRSCLAMNPNEGYREARRLMKEKYGQNYKIAAAYVDRLTNGPPIRSEDGNALQKFSVQLTSCKNALKDIGYLNKLENPDALRKVIERLPHGIRQKWREVVDDIIQRQNRDVTVEGIATFVEKRVRVATHPIFGNIMSDSKNNDSSKHRNRSGNGTPKGPHSARMLNLSKRRLFQGHVTVNARRAAKTTSCFSVQTSERKHWKRGSNLCVRRDFVTTALPVVILQRRAKCFLSAE